MSIALPTLHALLRIKARRIEQIERRAAEQALKVEHCALALAQAEQLEQACLSERLACNDKIVGLSSGTVAFQPSELLTLLHVLDTLQTRCAAAERETKKARLTHDQELQHLHSIKHELQVSQAQQQQLTERAQALQQSLDVAAQDHEDEENEETTAARKLVRADHDAELVAS